jgi:hypothetical protein
MGFLRRLLGGSPDDADTSGIDTAVSPDEVGMLTASEATFDLHADRARVSIWLRLRDPSFENEREQQGVFGLENSVMRALDAAGVGEHDTNSLESGYFAMRLVGDDADAIVAVVRPLLADVPGGSYLAVRRGGAGTAEERVDLGPAAAD